MNPEELGKLVRDVWIKWAKEQPNPKPSWLVEWDGLCESDKEVDRRIGLALWKKGMEDAARVCAKGLARANIYAKMTQIGRD